MFQFMDFWLSFMAIMSTYVYLATIDEAYKRPVLTAVAIFTALMAVTKATRYIELIRHRFILKLRTKMLVSCKASD